MRISRSYRYLNAAYRLNVRPGDRVRVEGRPGVVLRTRWNPQYIHVRFDGESRTSHCHPTWEVEYLPRRVDGAGILAGRVDETAKDQQMPGSGICRDELTGRVIGVVV